MSNLSRFFQYLKTREGGFSLLLVIACGVGLTSFVGLTFVDPTDHLYHLDFGKAQWIQASATPGESGFFRKTIFVSGPIDRAWIQLSSTDSYNLWVNGTLIGKDTFDGTCVSGLYDLKKKLQLGKNVIAVQVVRESFPGSAQLLVRGFYGLVGSPVQEFWSDPTDKTWRASTTPDGILNGYSWRNPLLDDSFWKLPKVAPENERFPVVDQVSLDPRLLENRPIGKWIASPLGSARQTSFAYNLQLPSNRRETWLEIAATGDYDLIINGRLITTETVSAVAGSVKVPAAEVLAVKPSLLAYNVTRWVRSGLNSLVIRVSSQTLQPPFLLADGYAVRGDGKLQCFGTDGTWNTLLYAKSGQPASVIADYGNQPLGTLEQAQANLVVSPIYDVIKVLTWGALVLAVLGGLLALWMLSATFASLVTRVPAEKLWTCDALFLLCASVLMLFLWLLTFDVRFATNWCFQPKIVWDLLAFVLAGRLLLLLPRRSAPKAETPEKQQIVPAAPLLAGLRRNWKVVALLCIVLLGFFLRARNLTTQSLDVDEYGLIQYSRGVQKKGYPYIRLGSFQKDISTYELISYSIAAGRQFLGETEVAFRTPSLICGTLAIALVGIVGYRMFGWRQGLTAALIYATYPCGLYYGINAFWPSQQQLFALVTIWCFFEAIRAGPLRPGFLTAATVFFILSYFSWEGTGFLLPTLIILMFAMRWGNCDWMKDWHLWRCFVMICFAVGMQLSYRQIESLPAFLQTGISLSDVTTPLPVWLDLTRYTPDFYFKECLFAENFLVMSVVMFVGIWFCWRDSAIRYLFLTIIMLVIWYTEFLPAYAQRYSYDYQVLLILISVAMLYKLFDRITGLRVSILRWPATAGLLVAFVLTTNGFVLQTYRLSQSPESGFYAYRMGIYRCGYREAARFVAAHFQPGDGLIVSIPHVFEYYSKLKADYSISTMLDKKITYSGAIETPAFLDKFKGYPCVRSLEELEDLRGRFKRLWILQVPIESQHPEVARYIAANARVAFLTYRGEVDLMMANSDPGRVYQRGSLSTLGE
jgi:Dolichyl-phosphate-mannose-protein mannosyltransferase